MGVAVKSFGPRSMAKRTFASFAFVLLCNPIDPIVLKAQSAFVSLPLVVLLFQWGVILAGHAYLINRAWYALKLKGSLYFIILFTLLYLSISGYLLDVGPILSEVALYLYGLLSLFYSYGLIFGPLDARLAGIMHTAEISK